MPKTELKVEGFECTRCKHKWIPHTMTKKPIACPKCKSPYWDVEKKKG